MTIKDPCLEDMSIDAAAHRLARELGGHAAEWAAIVSLDIKQTGCHPRTAYLSARDRVEAYANGDNHNLVKSLAPEDIAHALALYSWDSVYLSIRARMLPSYAPEVTRADYDWHADREDTHEGGYKPHPRAGDWLVVVDNHYHAVQTVLVQGHSAETAEAAMLVATLRAAEKLSSPEPWWCGGVTPLGQRKGGAVVRLWA